MYIATFLAVTIIINGIIFIDRMNVNAIKPTISTIGITENETNTIILYAAQVEEKYNWVDINGLENPSINLTSSKEYIFKIHNPKNEKHELIVHSESGGHQNISESPEIEPGANGEVQFKSGAAGEFLYFCQYHPDQMNAKITVNP
jgi:hypothetical protein